MKRILAVTVLALAACSTDQEEARPSEAGLPSILLVTLDTTRADHTGLEHDAVETPHLEALAAEGLWFTQAYTTAPMTLPAHASMLTGLYPSDHGVRENARTLAGDRTVLAERLREKGYRTAAFVSGLPLSSRFGLSRGFDEYDDDLGSAAERSAGETTDRALTWLNRIAGGPVFLWVHFFDPHEPYDPPEPFRSRHPSSPYLAEIAYMDQELGRLADAFKHRFQDGGLKDGGFKVLVVGDHGEGLGDHGEALHGNLLYQGVMRIPLVIAGTGVPVGRRTAAVSVRRVFDTVLGWAGFDRDFDLVDGPPEVVVGEAMKPFLQYGWQPQVMAVFDNVKVIRSAETEVYDVVGDPAESRDRSGEIEIGTELRQALQSYPFLPQPKETGSSATLSREDQEKLASLGYADWQGQTSLRDGAPSPKDMTPLFAALDAGSGYFVRQEYGKAIAAFEKVHAQDPDNLMVALRLAVAHSVEDRDAEAMKYFERARQISPGSADVRHYMALHFFRRNRWEEAAPLFESVLAQLPEKLPALESLARIREGEGRIDETMLLLERVVALRKDAREELLKLGDLRMSIGDTAGAISAFEQARGLAGEAFPRFLELGVLYLANRQLAEARECLDQVSPDHPGYPMALFKRAQVSVLLNEPDKADRIRQAWEQADPVTRPLIENEDLFQGVSL